MSELHQSGSPAPAGGTSDHGNCSILRKRKRPDDDGVDCTEATADDDGVKDKHPFDLDLPAAIYDILFMILKEDKTIPQMIGKIATRAATDTTSGIAKEVAIRTAINEIKNWVTNPKIDVLGLAYITGPKCVKCQQHLQEFIKMLEEKVEEMGKRIVQAAVQKSCDVVRKSINNEAAKMKGIREQVSKAMEEQARNRKNYEAAVAEIAALREEIKASRQENEASRQENAALRDVVKALLEKDQARDAEIHEFKAMMAEIQARL